MERFAKMMTAADALAPSGSTAGTPLPVANVLDHFAYELRDRLADVWTLRAVADAELTGPRHAAAVDTLAAELGHTLAPDACGPSLRSNWWWR